MHHHSRVIALVHCDHMQINLFIIHGHQAVSVAERLIHFSSGLVAVSQSVPMQGHTSAKKVFDL